jgi:hypothetical protein
MSSAVTNSNIILQFATAVRDAWLKAATPTGHSQTCPEVRSAAEIAYLSAAEDHADLERRLASLDQAARPYLHGVDFWLP